MDKTDFDMIRLYRWYAERDLKNGSMTKEEYDSVMKILNAWEQL